MSEVPCTEEIKVIRRDHGISDYESDTTHRDTIFPEANVQEQEKAGSNSEEGGTNEKRIEIRVDKDNPERWNPQTKDHFDPDRAADVIFWGNRYYVTEARRTFNAGVPHYHITAVRRNKDDIEGLPT